MFYTAGDAEYAYASLQPVNQEVESLERVATPTNVDQPSVRVPLRDHQGSFRQLLLSWSQAAQSGAKPPKFWVPDSRRPKYVALFLKILSVEVVT